MLATSTLHLKTNGRVGFKKAKTGCLTCKQARVRCDEDKPKCKRCVRIRLPCGYRGVFIADCASPASSTVFEHKRDPPIPPPARQISVIQFDSIERQLFDFYRSEVADSLGGFLDGKSWSTTILQIGHSEQVVLHSIIAVAAAFKEWKHLGDAVINPASELALTYYQRALKGASQRTEQQDSEVVAILTCPMFLCMEFMNGKKLQAMALFRHGHGILQTHSMPTRVRANASLYPVFERLTLMANLFGHEVKLPHRLGQDHQSERQFMRFSSLEEARDMLVRQLVKNRDFMKRTFNRGQAVNLPVELTEDNRRKHERMLIEQQRWYQQFQDLCNELRQDHPGNTAVIATLTTWHLVAIIWLNCPLEGSQMSFDAHLEDFRTVLEHGRMVIGVYERSKQNIVFTFDMGILPILYFTAIKCRHLPTRMEALHLMKKGPRREGLWKREELAAVAEGAIELESRHQENHNEWPDRADRILKIKNLQRDEGDYFETAFIFEDHVEMGTWRQS